MKMVLLKKWARLIDWCGLWVRRVDERWAVFVSVTLQTQPLIHSSFVASLSFWLFWWQQLPPNQLTTADQRQNRSLGTDFPSLSSKMVLAELGGKLRESLRKLHSSNGHLTEAQLNSVLSEVTRALIESDVNVRMVMTLRENVKQKVQSLLDDEDEEDEEKRGPSNVSKTVQKTVVEELVALLSPKRKPYVIKRSKPNVILFVGLQGTYLCFLVSWLIDMVKLRKC